MQANPGGRSLPSHDNETAATSGTSERGVAVRTGAGACGSAAGEVTCVSGRSAVLRASHWGGTSQAALVQNSRLSGGSLKIHVASNADTWRCRAILRRGSRGKIIQPAPCGADE